MKNALVLWDTGGNEIAQAVSHTALKSSHHQWVRPVSHLKQQVEMDDPQKISLRPNSSPYITGRKWKCAMKKNRLLEKSPLLPRPLNGHLARHRVQEGERLTPRPEEIHPRVEEQDLVLPAPCEREGERFTPRPVPRGHGIVPRGPSKESVPDSLQANSGLK